jgi:hypothetical protein
MFPRWKYSLFQSWFRRTVAFQKPLAFLSKIINCFTNTFDSKQLKYSPKVYIFALRRENGNSRRNEPLFLVSVDKLPTCWYSRLQLIRPLATEWLRNAWGNVDEFGHHVYDVMQRVRHVFVPYNKLGNLRQGDLVGSGVGRSNNTYSTMKRPAAVILPTESENESTTENVWSIRLSKYRTLVHVIMETYLLVTIFLRLTVVLYGKLRNIVA